jgi:hypothetical protein
MESSMTNPVGSRPVQQGDHPVTADRARVAKPAGVSPGHSQEITNGHLTRTRAVGGAIQPRIDALRVKLHITSVEAATKLGQKLLGNATINAQTIDARIAQLQAERAGRPDSFEKINHDIERLTNLKELQGLTATRTSLSETKENIWNEMFNLKIKLNDKRLPHAEFLKLAGEYRAKAAQLNSCSMKLTGEQECPPAKASVDIMDAIAKRFSNPPKTVTGNFLREQLRDMQNEFRTYAKLSGSATNTRYLELVRSNLHTALSKICGDGLMNNNLGVIPEIFKTIDGLGNAKA